MTRMDPEHLRALAKVVADLTEHQRVVLALVAVEGAVDRRDVARLALFRRNTRTAASVLKALARKGLIEPIRTCEYRLTVSGKALCEAT